MNYIIISSRSNEPSIIKFDLGVQPVMVSLRFKDWELLSFKSETVNEFNFADLMSTDNKVTFVNPKSKYYQMARKLHGYFYRQTFDVLGEYMLCDLDDKMFVAKICDTWPSEWTKTMLTHYVYFWDSKHENYDYGRQFRSFSKRDSITK